MGSVDLFLIHRSRHCIGASEITLVGVKRFDEQQQVKREKKKERRKERRKERKKERKKGRKEERKKERWYRRRTKKNTTSFLGNKKNI